MKHRNDLNKEDSYMRSKFFSYAILLALIGTLNLTTGCAWWKKHFGKKGAGSESGQNVAPLGTGGEIAGSERPPITGDLDHTTFAADTVLFDFDSAKVKPGEVHKLEAVATAMKGNSKNLIVEGYTDERGTAEYNRALGERRAQSCRTELVHLGVNASRITTISYGKDRPADPGHDEAAWAKNRRCEFALPQ
jgi:peptidoglycan-associated lipoprotein